MISDRVQWVRLKWLLGQMLVLLSLWTVSALDFAMGPIWVAVLFLTLAAIAYPALPARIPTLVRKWLAPVLVLFFLGDLVLSGRDLIPPMVRLLLVLLAIRALSVRTSREDLQLVLLAMFLSVVSGVFTLSILFAVQAALFAVITIGLLFGVNLLESTGEGERGDGEWENFSWSEFGGFLRRSVTPGMVRSMVILFALLLTTTGILFVSIPRVHLDQAIPFLQMPNSGKSGFSEVVRLGDVTSIQEDDSVAMQIDVPGIESVPSDPYWRMLILDRYANGAFINSLFHSPETDRQLPRVHTFSPFPDEWFVGQNTAAGLWTFYLQSGVSRYLPMLGPFAQLKFQGRQPLQSNPEILVFRIPQASSSVFSYQVQDFLVGASLPASDLDAPLLRKPSVEGIGKRIRYPLTTIEVPLDREERRSLGEILSSILDGTEEGPEEIGQKIQDYLQRTHSYTLSPGSYGQGDPIVQWLREGRAGHCEFFAGAFTLLAREAGVPTRMAVGFNGGSWNSFEDYFVVRNRNAHAWCEIFTGDSWLRFDPTPGGAGGRGMEAGSQGAGGFARDSDFQAWIDSLRVMWYRRVINFDDSSQEEMVENIWGVLRGVGNDVSEYLVSVWSRLSEWARAIFTSGRNSAVAVLVALGVIGLLIWVGRKVRFRWGGLGRKNSIHPLRRRAGRELQRLEKTVVDSARRVSKRDQLKDRLLEIRFGSAPDASEALRLFREVRRFRREKEF